MPKRSVVLEAIDQYDLEAFSELLEVIGRSYLDGEMDELPRDNVRLEGALRVCARGAALLDNPPEGGWPDAPSFGLNPVSLRRARAHIETLARGLKDTLAEETADARKEAEEKQS